MNLKNMKRRAFYQVVSGSLIYGLLTLPSSAAIVYTSSGLKGGTSYNNNWINVSGYSTSTYTNKIKLNHRSVKVGTGIGGSQYYSVRVQISQGGIVQGYSSTYGISSSSYTPVTITYSPPSSGYYNVTVQIRNTQSYNPGGAYYKYETNLFQLEN